VCRQTRNEGVLTDCLLLLLMEAPRRFDSPTGCGLSAGARCAPPILDSGLFSVIVLPPCHIRYPLSWIDGRRAGAGVIDYGPTGTWLRIPLSKLATERSVPLDAGGEVRDLVAAAS